MRGTKRFKAFHFLAPIFDGGGEPTRDNKSGRNDLAWKRIDGWFRAKINRIWANLRMNLSLQRMKIALAGWSKVNWYCIKFEW
jgi:hypothetical protein